MFIPESLDEQISLIKNKPTQEALLLIVRELQELKVTDKSQELEIFKLIHLYRQPTKFNRWCLFIQKLKFFLASFFQAFKV